MRKGFLAIIVGMVILIGGAVGVPLSILLPVIFAPSVGVTFLAPGEATLEATEGGRYLLWNNHHAIYDGKVYSQSEAFPDGALIRVVDESGAEIPFYPDQSFTVSSGSSASQSLGYVDATQGAKLTVSVKDISETRVVEFALSKFHKIGHEIKRGQIVLLLSLVVVGLVLVVIGAVSLLSSKSSIPVPR